MKGNRQLTRRRFLHKSLGYATACSSVPMILPSGILAADGQTGKNERIGIGMIGLGRQTVYVNLPALLKSPDTQLLAVCDVDTWRLEQAKETINKHYADGRASGAYKGCSVYRDFRELLAREDIDAVMIATPDHWHVPMALAAAKAGKDVCCEKPLTLSIAEGRLLSDTVSRYNRVFRTDSEFRSIPAFHRMCELVRNGRIGKLHTIRTGGPTEPYESPPRNEMPVPGELDYEMWLGPAPLAPYTEKRVHPPRAYGRPGWMRVRDYCDGMVCNWGTHLNDIAQWGNNTDRTGPVEVEGRGVYPTGDGLWNVLHSFEIEYRYASGVRLFYKTERPYVRFEGDEGWIEAEFGKNELKAHPESILSSKIGSDEIRFPLKSEKQDFIDAVKTRGNTLEDAEVGHRTTSLCHLGHIAIQVKGKLRWDPDAERFTNSDAANGMLTRSLRPPWQWG